MIEETLDVTELPVAKTVKDGDQLLLVRTQKNGVKVPMRMEPQKLTKQKKQQIVIGRAIRPQACKIGGVENWYVFGRAPWHNRLLLLRIASMFPCYSDNLNFGYDMVVLNITNQKTGNVYVFKDVASTMNFNNFYDEFFATEDTAQTTNWQACFFEEAGLANAFRVDSYDLTERVLTLNLTHKCLRTNDLRGTSTHHYFKDGVRRWHVSKKAIAAKVFDASNFAGSYVMSKFVSESITDGNWVLLKKEVVQHPHIRGSAVSYSRGLSNVVSYSKVKYNENTPSCQMNCRKSKRRPYGKYKIWLLQSRFPHRKSDEYLHCRMKCVGLGERKEHVLGPHFDRYLVTVREI